MLRNKKQLTLKLSAITISVLLSSYGVSGGIMDQLIMIPVVSLVVKS